MAAKKATEERVKVARAEEERAADAAKSNAKSNPNDARGGDGTGDRGGGDDGGGEGGGNAASNKLHFIRHMPQMQQHRKRTSAAKSQKQKQPMIMQAVTSLASKCCFRGRDCMKDHPCKQERCRR